MKKKVVIGMMTSLLIIFSNSLSSMAEEAMEYKNPTQYLFSGVDYDSVEPAKDPEPEPEPIIEEVGRFADWEVVYLKKTITAECGHNQPDSCVRSSTDVVINRVDSEKFPDTISSVVAQKNQFETYSNGAIAKVTYIPDQIDRIVDEELENGVNDPKVLFFTAGYYNPYCIPDYKAGDHYFGH